MYIQTQKSSKVKPHHPTDRSISRLWPTLPSQLVLGRVGEKSLWPTLGEPGWWVNQCHCASSSLNLPPQWIFGCMMFGIKFTGWLLHFFLQCRQSNFSSLKGQHGRVLWLMIFTNPAPVDIANIQLLTWCRISAISTVSLSPFSNCDTAGQQGTYCWWMGIISLIWVWEVMDSSWSGKPHPLVAVMVHESVVSWDQAQIIKVISKSIQIFFVGTGMMPHLTVGRVPLLRKLPAKT